MKWISIGGSWRKQNKQLENDVRGTVKEVMDSGNGMISGGALGVDYIATNEALKLDPTARRIKIFLPTTLDIYIQYYRKKAKEGVITEKKAEDLSAQLKRIKINNPASIIENKKNKIVNKNTYAQRDSEIIRLADEAVSFHVNQSPAMKENIKKIRQRGIPLKVFTYTIE